MYGHTRPPKQRAADQRSLAEMFQPAKRVSQECRDAATSTSVNCISDDSQSGVAAGEDDDSVQTVSDGVGNMKSGGGIVRTWLRQLQRLLVIVTMDHSWRL